ncbi:TPA: hypothetical protein ACK3Q6_003178 [Burkholderia cepacia]|nr:hypothetical protein [Burkholderia cepacia ATCC 25416]HDR9785951.1 hypothetical protein [Burkholderia cepacia ATCC 25416]HDR9794746.1 hypothetical protein [Burkholderia cepacia ATCC 25416]
MMNYKNNKKQHGQFFTTRNPFHNELFSRWIAGIENYQGLTFGEPFAGSNNLVKLARELPELENSQWRCFDVDPKEESQVPEFAIEKRNTLEDYPKGLDVVITNPPYLAKNSASKSGLPFPDTAHDNLYKLSLDVMLKNTPYVAAIIPESFVASGLFIDRLLGVVSLNFQMFEDTECPVCLALFVPYKATYGVAVDDYLYAQGNTVIGTYQELKARQASLVEGTQARTWKFNHPQGEIGLYAIDGHTQASIRFVAGSEIAPENVKKSSRGNIRIGGLPTGVEAQDVINMANEILIEYRKSTADVFMTPFRGLRKDNCYRRRLDFAQARDVLNCALERLHEKVT